MSKVQHTGRLKRVVITTEDGRVFDLGRPYHFLIGNRLFKYRHRRYIKTRYDELIAAGYTHEELLHG